MFSEHSGGRQSLANLLKARCRCLPQADPFKDVRLRGSGSSEHHDAMKPAVIVKHLETQVANRLGSSSTGTKPSRRGPKFFAGCMPTCAHRSRRDLGWKLKL